MTHDLRDVQLKADARMVAVDGLEVAADFGDTLREYRAFESGQALHDRSFRGLIVLSGNDRANWLHNFCTQSVTGLKTGDARYAFACDVKGRVLFDMVLAVREREIWLDVDRRLVDAAMKHFNKYVISEDVTIENQSDRYDRLAIIGRGLEAQFNDQGKVGQTGPMAIGCATTVLAGCECLELTGPIAGFAAVDYFVPIHAAAEAWSHLLECGAVAVGWDAVQIRRVEAGIPWMVEDMQDDVLPAETGLFDRAVALNKGCYLGQEIIERMRSRGSMARKIVGVCADKGRQLTAGMNLTFDGATVGKITSAVESPASRTMLGLAHVRMAHSENGQELAAETTGEAVSVKVVQLPVAGK